MYKHKRETILKGQCHVISNHFLLKRFDLEKRFRELFSFCEDIWLQSSKIVCPYSCWLRRHTIISLDKQAFIFLNYCYIGCVNTKKYLLFAWLFGKYKKIDKCILDSLEIEKFESNVSQFWTFENLIFLTPRSVSLRGVNYFANISAKTNCIGKPFFTQFSRGVKMVLIHEINKFQKISRHCHFRSQICYFGVIHLTLYCIQNPRIWILWHFINYL